jgi:hypothetical protein
MSDTWISALCEFMAPHDIQLKLCDMNKWLSYDSTHKHDSSVMDHFLKSKFYSDRQLEDLNQAHISHQALTISDIAYANSDQIQERYYISERNA